MFHVLIGFACFVRGVTLPMSVDLFASHSPVAQYLLSTVPAQLFFSAYLLLCAYWASVYYAAAQSEVLSVDTF
jgi:hypothetical protein